MQPGPLLPVNVLTLPQVGVNFLIYYYLLCFEISILIGYNPVLLNYCTELSGAYVRPLVGIQLNPDKARQASYCHIPTCPYIVC